MFGQAPSPAAPWPRFEAKTYAVAVNYQTPAMRLDMLRAQGEHGRVVPFENMKIAIGVAKTT